MFLIKSSDFPIRFVGSLGTIIVKCKDLRVIQLDIPGLEECLNIANSIEVKKHNGKIFTFTFFNVNSECVQLKHILYSSLGSVHA